jgi:hypothetical protein
MVSPWDALRDVGGFLVLLLALLLPVWLVGSQCMTRPAYGESIAYGYTWSLLLFALPATALALWVARGWGMYPPGPAPRQVRIERRALVRVALAVTLFGYGMDFLIADLFFRFPDPAARLGWNWPGLDWHKDAGGWRLVGVGLVIPVEEVLFYVSGGLFMAVTYVWGSLWFFESYRVALPAANSPPSTWAVRRTGQGFEIDVWTLLLGLGLAGAGYWFQSSRGNGIFPGYLAFLLALGFIPSSIGFASVRGWVNWRAFAFMEVTLVLVSVIYEGTLALHHGWWDYERDWMVGVYASPWWDLPIEATLLWLLAGWPVALLHQWLAHRIALRTP